MLKRIRPSIGSAHVIALLALFAALGGGYATAFSGSGTLQKGSLTPVTGTFTTVRSLTGIGIVSASCVAGDITIRFSNTSGEAIDLYRERWAGEGSDAPVTGKKTDVPNNSNADFTVVSGTEAGQERWHVVPDDGSKAPQADATVASATGLACTGTRVTVLALNTQQ